MSEFPVIDAHHHIWRFDRTPWLNGPMVPRIFGDYAAIRRDYSISEFAADAKPQGVTKSVYIQINVAPGDEVWEAEWAAAQGDAEGLVQAVVSYVDLAEQDVGDVLDRQCAVAPVRGVRQQLHWHRNPLYRFASRPDMMLDSSWQRGLKEVMARGLHFELQVFQNQYADALTLIDRFPDLTFVLLHAGMPEDLSHEGLARWAGGLVDFARRPNVLTKLSAFGTFTHSCDADEWAVPIRRAVDVFGPERSIFGSNFPVEKLWTDYASLLSAVRHGISVYSTDEQDHILHHTAAKLYRI